MQFTMPDLKFL